METNRNIDPAHDIWRQRRPLDAFFAPRTVALIGATDRPGSVGRTILSNLMRNPFGGTILPVNPKRSNVMGIKSYPSICDIQEKIDLAILVTPAETTPKLVSDCVASDVKSAIIISAGFREVGPAGAELERQIREQIKGKSLRIIGPNCLGVMNPYTGLNATFASAMAKRGNVGFISQSGALGTAVLDWSLRENVGFSAFMSIGTMLDIGWGDMIDYLGDDPNTHSIVIYMESIGDARSFLSAAREVALTKPIVVIKAGRTEAASKAAASHTGALTGSDEALNAAFQRCGVLRVETIEDLFSMAHVLAKQPRPKGPNLTIVTNAGGPGVLATDAIITAGGKFPELSKNTVDSLNQILPPHWSHGNPVDILGDADPERYAKAVEIVTQDPETDGILVILTPQAMTDPTRTAERLKSLTANKNKPLLASWMGGSEVESGRNILNLANIPVFEYPDVAARVFHYMWQYSDNLRSIYETPTLPEAEEKERLNRSLAQDMIAKIRASGRTILTEFESKKILMAYGIPTIETQAASSSDEAVQIAERMGYPVVLKLLSETITHKTDFGGVHLNLVDSRAVREAFSLIENSIKEKMGAHHFKGVTVQPFIKVDGYELILGSSVDIQLGPILLFGMGGILVEILKDRALGLPPLTTTLARRMMEGTRIYEALKGVRGRKMIDLDLLSEILVLFSRLVVEQRWIKEIDINPLMASHDRIVALDARIILHGNEVTEDKLPKLAIRPYPTKYIKSWTLKSGAPVIIRPIRPEDELLLVEFHKMLSEETVHKRYFHAMNLSARIAHERLVRRCFNDYDREIALVVERNIAETEGREIIAVGRLSKIQGKNEAEWAIIVSDRYQHEGLGTELLERLIFIGREENLSRLSAVILQENFDMQNIAKKLGFHLQKSSEDSEMIAEMDLERLGEKVKV